MLKVGVGDQSVSARWIKVFTQSCPWFSKLFFNIIYSFLLTHWPSVSESFLQESRAPANLQGAASRISQATYRSTAIA